MVTIIHGNLPGLILAAANPLMPTRILAVIALMAVIGAFVYVLRHLNNIEKIIATDDLVPARRGPRNNMVLMICAIPIIIVALLLFLIINA